MAGAQSWCCVAGARGPRQLQDIIMHAMSEVLEVHSSASAASSSAAAAAGTNLLPLFDMIHQEAIAPFTHSWGYGSSRIPASSVGTAQSGWSPRFSKNKA